MRQPVKRDPAEPARRRRPQLLRRVADFYRTVRNENLPRILFLALILVLGGGLLVFVVELSRNRESFPGFFDALWWAVVTITTVGYGDRVPITVPGRLVAMLVMLMGVVVTSLLSGTIASIFVDRKIREGRGLQDVNTKGHIIICGWNGRAEAILDALQRLATVQREIVLVNEMDPEEFQELDTRYPTIALRFVRGDFTNERALKRGAITEANSAIIVSDESGQNQLANADERTIMGALAISSLQADITISAELINRENEQHLRRAKVNDIVVYGEFNGFLHATATTAEGIPLLVKELLKLGGSHSLREIPVPASFVGRTFVDLFEHLLSDGQGTLIGLLSVEKKMSLDDILSEDSSAIDDFIKRKFAEADIELEEDQAPELHLVLNPKPDYSLRDTDLGFIISTANSGKS